MRQDQGKQSFQAERPYVSDAIYHSSPHANRRGIFEKPPRNVDQRDRKKVWFPQPFLLRSMLRPRHVTSRVPQAISVKNGIEEMKSPFLIPERYRKNPLPIQQKSFIKEFISPFHKKKFSLFPAKISRGVFFLFLRPQPFHEFLVMPLSYAMPFQEYPQYALRRCRRRRDFWRSPFSDMLWGRQAIRKNRDK